MFVCLHLNCPFLSDFSEILTLSTAFRQKLLYHFFLEIIPLRTELPHADGQ
jgi:hypothetical protein